MPNDYKPTLRLDPSEVHAGDYFDVFGEGFDPKYGNVIIGFVAGGWGSPVAGDGTITVTGIPALSGDTLPAGEWPVTAYQHVKANGKKLDEVAEAILNVVE